VKKTAPPPESPPTDAAGFERFQAELARLVAQFEKNFKLYQSPAYGEASVRQDFLDPLFRALGWDVGNRLGLIPQHREVEIESRTEVAGRQKRADYLFRTDRIDRFVCEAKKPAETLHAAHAFQAKRYAWNKGLVLAVLSDFEEIKIYLVGAKPHPDETAAGEWKTWHFLEYAKFAPDIWNLLSRGAVAAGSIEKLVASLPRKPAGKTKAKQQWLFKPDRARAIDADFLDFLDEARRGLASDLIRRNDRADLLEGARLDEAVQRILDRLLFLRICEDRDIDTGRPLATILKTWRGRKDTPLWRDVVAHFRALDRRPASHVPYFNGNLFKEHFSEDLDVGDDWLADFLEETGAEESPYLFNVIPVEILGTIYERFLGKTVRPHGRGVVIEDKPEVRKAGGVYYTPRYIVDYIVEQTLGKLLEGKAPLETLKLRVLDPACGSGSFLIRAYERLCEHWQTALTKDEKLRRKADCWLDPDTGDLHLTTDLKRRILVANVYGVDLDPGAVEVSQLSLYLKMLEGESRATLAHNRELFGPDAPLLPPLQDNVKCGNSLIASDFSLNPDDLLRVRAFDWEEGFREIMKGGGFDAVIGNPPYVRQESLKESKAYFQKTYEAFSGTGDLYTYFMERGVKLLKPGGRYSIIVSSSFLRATYAESLRAALRKHAAVHRIVDFGGLAVFADAKDTYVCIPLLIRGEQPHKIEVSKVHALDADIVWPEMSKTDFHISPDQLTQEGWILRSKDETDLLRKITDHGVPLGKYIGGKMFYGIKTGFNDAFVISAAQRDEMRLRCSACDSVIHPFRSGEDIREYFIESPDCWLIVLPAGWTRAAMGASAPETKAWSWLEKQVPPITEHLQPFKKQLQDRQDQGDFWWELRPCDYYDVFSQPKIVFPDICKFPRFCYDDTGIYLTNTAYALGTGDKYILGILNSKVFWFAISNISIPFGVRAGEFRYRLIYQYMEKVPIRAADLQNPADRAMHDKLVGLVDKMLLLVPKLRAAKSEGDRATLQNAVSATDRQIDALVYELYGLTPEEIGLVEGGHA